MISFLTFYFLSDCTHDLPFEISGIYVDEKFHLENALKLYENSLANETEEIIQKWLPVLKSSLEKCEKASKKIY